MTIEADYVVKGAGAMAMAFVDALVANNPDVTVAIIDRRYAPGGHWNDAYPFVRLHQPSSYYGVASRELSKGRKDVSGFNAGLNELASGVEVADYFHQVMRDQLLPTGRVQYVPMSDFDEAKGAVTSLLSGERRAVKARKKLVDATRLETIVPLTHTRSFSVADGVACIPPNDLTRQAPGHERYMVLGAGKTAMDSILWLLANGAPANRISWVRPREAWLLNRLNSQPGLDFFETSLGAIATQYEICATAASVRDLCERMEAGDQWLRIDREVWPSMFHAATVTVAEVEALRTVSAIRLGRVKSIERNKVVFENGETASDAGCLYVDCTARGLSRNLGDNQAVFEDGRINVQMIRNYQPAYSAAVIGFIEATIEDEVEKRKLARPTPMTDTVEDWVRGQAISMANQATVTANPLVNKWINTACRLNAFASTLAQVSPDDADKQAILRRIGMAAGPSAMNLARLAAG